MSKRRVCRLLGLNHSVFDYQTCSRNDGPLIKALSALAERYLLVQPIRPNLQ
ncbi:hypothetical protein L0E83_08595 [Marichromatium gracile]|uniref:hypothetical protein n=1 Tax=Marichromatium gracile TaxID=1048 RepID=UPI0013663CEA|nr:hypothetical protein [Marichromatium gracile]MCF1183493.1 hypothetical protein [Marichromatium gracile]